MFRPTDRQMPLLSASARLPDSSRRRLERSWAQGFREVVYPLLLEAEAQFADLYHQSTGRPAWSIARKLGVCVLQGLLDLGDEAALDALSFDARWQYALDLTAEDASLSRRRLIDFRSRMVERDPEMERMRALFERVGQEAIGDLGLSVDLQRQDSTFFTSNIRTRGRLDLFQKTLAHFLDWLSSWAPSKLELLSEDMLEWYAEPPAGTFGKASRDEVRARVLEVAGWLVEVLTVFGDDREVRASEPYELVARLVREHCRPVDVDVEAQATTTSPSEQQDQACGDDDRTNDGDEQDGDGDDGDDDGDDDDRAYDEAEADSPDAADPGGDEEPGSEPNSSVTHELLDAPVNGGASLQSPFDPDAGYGHKGKGYLAQITETCGNEGPTEILTDFEVHGSHVSDHGKTTESLDRLSASGLAPRELSADAGYTSGEAFQDAELRGVDLQAPVLGQPQDALLRQDFEVDAGGCVVRCPGGHAPVRHGLRVQGRGRDRTPHVWFDAATCRGCALRERCPVRLTDKARTGYLDIGPAARARDRAIEAQREESWWHRYKLRAGIEATNSELKRAHGLGRLRVRGRPRVLLAVTAKLTACNIKRWLRARAARQEQVHRSPGSPHPESPSPCGPTSIRSLLNAITRLLEPLIDSYESPDARSVVPQAA